MALLNLIAVMALAVSLAAFGAALLSWMGRPVLSCLTRPERAAFALLIGMAGGGLACLFAMLAGWRLSVWWWAVVGGAGVAVSALRWRILAEEVSVPTTACLPGERLLVASLVAMFLWSSLVALSLPATDYDTLAIWDHRLRVLLEERTLTTGSLRDPLRFVAQPLHPYLVPVIEALFCLAAGGYSPAARNAPYLLAYGIYLMLVAGASRRIAVPWRRLALLTAAGLMPVLATAPVLLSSREFLMSVFAFACVSAFILWIESAAAGALLVAAWCALACQQVKIEGLPFAVGFFGSALLWALGGSVDRARRLSGGVIGAAAMFLLSIPWMLARRDIPAVNVEGLVKDFDVSLMVNPRYLSDALRIVSGEIFGRPELYGLAGLAVLAGVATGWRRGEWRMRLAVLLPPLVLLAAIVVNLSARVGEGPERLLSLPRRMMIVLPALVLAALHVFGSGRRRPD